MFGCLRSILKPTPNIQSKSMKNNLEESLGKAIITHFQDEIKCSICWRYSRTIAPCLHNFCSFCLSEYLSRNYWQALCPLCRGDIQSWNKNSLLDKLIECLGDYNSGFRTSEEEKKLRDERDMLIKGARIQKPMALGNMHGQMEAGIRDILRMAPWKDKESGGI